VHVSRRPSRGNRHWQLPFWLTRIRNDRQLVAHCVPAPIGLSSARLSEDGRPCFGRRYTRPILTPRTAPCCQALMCSLSVLLLRLGGSRSARPAASRRLFRLGGGSRWFRGRPEPMEASSIFTRETYSVQWRNAWRRKVLSVWPAGTREVISLDGLLRAGKMIALRHFRRGRAACSSRLEVAPCELPWCLVMCHGATCHRLLMCSLTGAAVWHESARRASVCRSSRRTLLTSTLVLVMRVEALWIHPCRGRPGRLPDRRGVLDTLAKFWREKPSGTWCHGAGRGRSKNPEVCILLTSGTGFQSRRRVGRGPSQ
jgi:hypothetical protein